MPRARGAGGKGIWLAEALPSMRLPHLSPTWVLPPPRARAGFFAIVEGKGLEFAKNQVRNDLGGILIKNWSIFLPATVINIAFCPPELRVLFLNCVCASSLTFSNSTPVPTCHAYWHSMLPCNRHCRIFSHG